MTTTATHEDRMMAAVQTPEATRLVTVARKLLVHLIAEGVVPPVEDEAEEAKAVGLIVLKLAVGESERAEDLASVGVHDVETPARDALAGVIWAYHNN